jgi:hypothetical protein
MLRVIFSPWVAVIRHSQVSPSVGGLGDPNPGDCRVAEFSWWVRPHSGGERVELGEEDRGECDDAGEVCRRINLGSQGVTHEGELGSLDIEGN